MGLTSDCLKYVHCLVLVEPIVGIGWTFGPQSLYRDFENIQSLGSFHAVVNRFFEWRGELRGGLATIKHSGHLFDGQLVSFSTRSVGNWNFTNQQGFYNISIGEKEIENAEGPLHVVGGKVDAHGMASIRDPGSSKTFEPTR